MFVNNITLLLGVNSMNNRKNFTIVFFLLCFNVFFITPVMAEECNTNISPNMDTDKFIVALNCLNRKVEYLENQLIKAGSDAMNARSAAQDASERAAAESAGRDAAAAARETSMKLDGLFRRLK